MTRSEQVDNLNQFKVLKFVAAETFANTPGAVWIGSRWVDGTKDSGCVRSRWVLQEFATKKVHGEFFSPTPDALEVELLHLHALEQQLDLCYVDVQRAFLHAPETQKVFTKAPQGWEQDGMIVQFLRKVNGRREGS